MPTPSLLMSVTPRRDVAEPGPTGVTGD